MSRAQRQVEGYPHISTLSSYPQTIEVPPRLFGALMAVLLVTSGCEGDEECFGASECGDGRICVSTAGEQGPGSCVPEVSQATGDVYVDPSTGLQWQVTPTVGLTDWGSAVTHCEHLDLQGTGWRLPDVGELRSLIRACPATETGGSCKITNECLSFDSCETAECGGCLVDTGPAGGCFWPQELSGSCSSFHWSSSTIVERSDRAFYVIFSFAHMSVRTKTFFFGVARCVRS